MWFYGPSWVLITVSHYTSPPVNMNNPSLHVHSESFPRRYVGVIGVRVAGFGLGFNI